MKTYKHAKQLELYWPAHPDDPQGIRVASVIEFSVCLWICVFWANFLISGRRHVI